MRINNEIPLLRPFSRMVPINYMPSLTYAIRSVSLFLQNSKNEIVDSQGTDFH